MHFTNQSTCILYGTHMGIVQNMLDYDYLCGRSPSVAAVLSSQKSSRRYKVMYGDQEMFIPTISSRDEIDQFPHVDTLINLASFRTCTSVNLEAIDSGKFKQIFTIAEWVSERETRQVIAAAQQSDVTMFGPSIVGGMICGVFRISHTGGSLENIIKSRLYQQGSVGIVSKSGGMMNELCRVVSKHADGVHTALQVWGDRYPMTTFKDVLRYYESVPGITSIVMLGEVGNRNEIEIADMIAAGELTKPIIARCIGDSAEQFTSEVQFGHAGAKANSDEEKATYKNTYLRDKGAHVPDNFDTLGDKIGEVFRSLGGEQPALETPADILDKVALLKSRRKTRFTATISDERGDELHYHNIPITQHVRDGSLAKVIGHLWLKRELPDYACEFINAALILLADHGPAVSGATNTIITARAGKDIVSSLIAGLATIGPRFGGAITGAGRMFVQALQDDLTPAAFVTQQKKAGILIQGIGHKIKSIYNPDMRCTLMREIAAGFPEHTALDFALAVEEITTQKKPNLILNVDGHIAALLIDLLTDLGYSLQEIAQLVEADLFNAFFVIARSIWFVGHYLDQQRLNEWLYRTPYEDVMYWTDAE